MPDDTEQTSAQKWEAEFWQTAMAAPSGRFVIAELLDRCGSRQRRFTGDGDTHGAAFRDGAASIGDYIESMLEAHCADRWMQMIRERRAYLGRLAKQVRDEEGRRTQNTLGQSHRIVDADAESMTIPPHPLPGGRTRIDELADAQLAENEKASPAAEAKDRTKGSKA